METGYQMPQTMESTLCELSIVMNKQGRISGKFFPESCFLIIRKQNGNGLPTLRRYSYTIERKTARR